MTGKNFILQNLIGMLGSFKRTLLLIRLLFQNLIGMLVSRFHHIHIANAILVSKPYRYARKGTFFKLSIIYISRFQNLIGMLGRNKGS